MQWTEGFPPKPWSEEWFIAETTFGDRVVLKALPKEWTYDFKTADDTYIKADKITRWMQFPDSQFVSPSPPGPTRPVEMEKLAAALHEAQVYGIGATSDANQKIIVEAAATLATYRAMPLQDGAVTQDKRGNET